MKSIIPLLLASTVILFSPDNSKAEECPGICLDIETCKYRGGVVIFANCSRAEGNANPGGEKACCDFSEKAQHSCGAIKTSIHVTNFKSPGYPEYYGGSLICQFQLNLNENTVGVKIDFKDLKLPGKPLELMHFQGNNSAKVSPCDSDWFFIKGFPDWMPDPFCGDLTGYSTIAEIDKEKYQSHLTIVFIMSSEEYRWNIKLTQISSYRIRKMDYCLWKRMNNWNNVLAGFGKNYTTKDSKTVNSSTDLPSNIKRPKSTPTHVSIRIMKNQNDPDGQINQSCKVPSSHLCSGVLIDDRHVITSASCFFSKGYPSTSIVKKSNIKIYINGSRSRDGCGCTSNGTLYDIETITFHINYGNWPISHDNIALIRTKKNMIFNLKILPVILPHKGWTLNENDTNLITSNDTADTEFHSATSSILLKNMTKCPTMLDFAKHYQENNTNVSEVALSRKYDGVMNGLLCFTIINEKVRYAPFLVQFDSKSKSKFPILIGIQNQAFSSSSTLIYTKISFYRKWIMMGIS